MFHHIYGVLKRESFIPIFVLCYIDDFSNEVVLKQGLLGSRPLLNSKFYLMNESMAFLFKFNFFSSLLVFFQSYHHVLITRGGNRPLFIIIYAILQLGLWLICTICTVDIFKSFNTARKLCRFFTFRSEADTYVIKECKFPIFRYLILFMLA